MSVGLLETLAAADSVLGNILAVGQIRGAAAMLSSITSALSAAGIAVAVPSSVALSVNPAPAKRIVNPPALIKSLSPACVTSDFCQLPAGSQWSEAGLSILGQVGSSDDCLAACLAQPGCAGLTYVPDTLQCLLQYQMSGGVKLSGFAEAQPAVRCDFTKGGPR